MHAWFRHVSRVATVIVGGLLLAACAQDPTTNACSEPTRMRFDVTGKITRSEIGFTQGFEVRDGMLYESTGRIGGTTKLNTISFAGQVTRLNDIGLSVFGEGLTILKDEIFQLTWQDHKVFVYDLTGKRKREMTNPRDGWGLTNNGTDLIFSDGFEDGLIGFGPPLSSVVVGAFAVATSPPLQVTLSAPALGDTFVPVSSSDPTSRSARATSSG